MKAEQILQSNLLDIIFENKNKDYGAYALRKNYNNRLYKAIGIMAMAVLLFVGLTSMNKKEPEMNVFVSPDIKLETITVEKPKEIKKEIKEVKPEKSTVKTEKQVSYNEPIIVEDKVKLEDKIKTTEELVNVPIGAIDVPGDDIGGRPKITSGDKLDTVTYVAPKVAEVIEDKSPMNFAEHMPEYPGGLEALRKFMLKNLRQPDDLQAGEKIVVQAKFVVNADGDIIGVEISQNGRNDLDKEVLRVINKMPKWKAGIQNGRNVAVYYKLPVTFVGAEE